MTNQEWGAPLTGAEMRALKGRVDPEVPVGHMGYGKGLYSHWIYDSPFPYHLPADHPYYTLCAHNLANPDKQMVLHDGSAEVPDDWAGGSILSGCGDIYLCSEDDKIRWPNIIAYTPKPKEEAVPEEPLRDEAIAYVLREFGVGLTVRHVREYSTNFPMVLAHARLIQTHEPERLKSAVEIAAEAYVDKNWKKSSLRHPGTIADYKAGWAGCLAWQKENG